METIKIILAFIGAGCVICSIGILLYVFFARGKSNGWMENDKSMDLEIRNFN